MIRVSNIAVPPEHTKETILSQCAQRLHIKPQDLRLERIVKRSIDARKKPDIFYIYTIDVHAKQEHVLLKHSARLQISPVKEESYHFPKSGTDPLKHRPIIIGSGPCGLFCGYLLAENGYRPILLERGAPIEERIEDVARFWEQGILNPESNVQFGEGGAGTFSDGKLNTMVKDPSHRGRKMLETFVKCGAPEEILYISKPHIGTDVLRKVVVNLRRKLTELGGEIRFHSCLTDFHTKDGAVTEIQINHQVWMPAQVVVLALGHSARDTFAWLYQKKLLMHPKAFAVGLRIEHPREMINCSQYGPEYSRLLPTADYKLTAQTSYGKGVYSFCMCPGGYVVNASSEPERLAVNGMSNHARDSRNSNSALIVTVTPEDFQAETGETGVFAGMHFQQKLESLAYRAGEGKIPVQLWGDFAANRISHHLGQVLPENKGGYRFANLRTVLPERLSFPLMEAMNSFGRRIRGFDRPDAVLSGVESRTSSPLRIDRDEGYESNIRGIYPCGEGAGFAGGITSAAMDGIRAAELIGIRYQRPEE